MDALAEAPVEVPESALPTAGVARAIAMPAPNATANPPTRPTYLAQLILVPFAATPLPLRLDNTFGPEVRYVKAPAAGQVNLPPSAGMQFFGDVQIEAKSAAMTVHLRDLTGASLWNTTIAPHRG